VNGYGSWSSPITAEAIVEAVSGITEPNMVAGELYWLESRPTEGGRVTLLKQVDEEPRELTPAPLNVRSRVHEYGGAAYLVCESGTFFINAADQNLYEVATDGAIRQITDSDASVRYADMCMDAANHRLIAVTEIHGDAPEPENALASIDIKTGSVALLAQGHDFYASPRLSPSGDELVYIVWDHPNMPWDGTQLIHAKLQDGQLAEETVVAGGACESVLQPSWLPDGSLLFVSDASNFWNLYRWDATGVYAVLVEPAEYASPPWQFGCRNYAVVNEQFVVACRHFNGEQDVVLIDLTSGFASPLLDGWAAYTYLSSDAERIYCVGTHSDRSGEIIAYDLAARSVTKLVESASLGIDSAWFSQPQHIGFTTRDGQEAFAYLYQPCNPEHSDSRGKPPLMVMSHGGPTGSASATLSLGVQFYTSRGWAVADVNYRGSTGYGRPYRDALKGQWGNLDVTDCEDAVNHLIAKGVVDAMRVAIRGGSAGGYTTLRALTTTTAFRAGASHYGIGDLSALARDTHKFESRYLEELLGSESALVDRSPIHHLDGFNCPVIFFQGGEDKIVPPNQAHEMVAALRDKGLPVAYVEFPDEGHGFRDADNIVRAIGCEYAFLCEIFDIDPAEDLPHIKIENL
jgi:dipeptidyl aminopeptidase/acylaminoacyl peptidase